MQTNTTLVCVQLLRIETLRHADGDCVKKKDRATDSIKAGRTVCMFFEGGTSFR